MTFSKSTRPRRFDKVTKGFDGFKRWEFEAETGPRNDIDRLNKLLRFCAVDDLEIDSVVLFFAMARRSTLFLSGTVEESLGNAKDGDRWS
jgi:hypothetical protein